MPRVRKDGFFNFTWRKQHWCKINKLPSLITLKYLRCLLVYFRVFLRMKNSPSGYGPSGISLAFVNNNLMSYYTQLFLWTYLKVSDMLSHFFFQSILKTFNHILLQDFKGRLFILLSSFVILSFLHQPSRLCIYCHLSFRLSDLKTTQKLLNWFPWHFVDGLLRDPNKNPFSAYLYLSGPDKWADQGLVFSSTSFNKVERGR